VLGITFILIMIFAPEGIVGRARLALDRRRARTIPTPHPETDHGSKPA
jgi:branched-chain amino acid transport system permease protein